MGAVSMLGEGRGCISVDLGRILELSDDDDDAVDETRRDIAKRLRMLLTPIDRSWEEGQEKRATGNYTPLRQIANEARSRALGWDERACSRALLDILNGLPPSQQSFSV